MRSFSKMTDEKKIDLIGLLPTITNIMGKVDFDKLKNIKVDKIKIVYKKQNNRLMLNIKHEPENKGFNDNFIEILKLTLGSDPNCKLEVSEVQQ